MIFSEMRWVAGSGPKWILPYSALTSMTARPTEECQPNIRISTLSSVMARRTARMPFSGLDSLSTQTNSKSRASPPTVTGRSPAARASSRAMLTPFLTSSPTRAAGPEWGLMTPILIASAATASVAAALAARAPAATTPVANAAVQNSLIEFLPFVEVVSVAPACLADPGCCCVLAPRADVRLGVKGTVFGLSPIGVPCQFACQSRIGFKSVRGRVACPANLQDSCAYAPPNRYGPKWDWFIRGVPAD